MKKNELKDEVSRGPSQGGEEATQANRAVGKKALSFSPGPSKATCVCYASLPDKSLCGLSESVRTRATLSLVGQVQLLTMVKE